MKTLCWNLPWVAMACVLAIRFGADGIETMGILLMFFFANLFGYIEGLRS